MGRAVVLAMTHHTATFAPVAIGVVLAGELFMAGGALLDRRTAKWFVASAALLGRERVGDLLDDAEVV